MGEQAGEERRNQGVFLKSKNRKTCALQGAAPMKKSFVKLAKEERAPLSKLIARFIRDLVDVYYPTAEQPVPVMDNLNTRTLAALYEVVEPAEARRLIEKLEVHYTPKHGSWLNMAEIEFSVLSRQCLDHRIGSRTEPEREVAAWQAKRNGQAVGINWRFTTTDARIKLKHLYLSIAD
jgi:hypothetical protein